jgi:hypothetical protein
MKRIGLALVLGGALLAGACGDNDGGVVVAPVEPLAAVRFVNAVPDTFGMDWRFIDQLTNSPTWMNLRFREFGPYQAAAPGARKLRIFTSTAALTGVPNTMPVASTVMIDETVNLQAGKYYTLVHYGNARAGSSPADRLLVIEDQIPTPGTNVAYRALNLGFSGVDVFADASSTSTLPASPTFANVAAGAASAYQTRAPGTLAYRATASGSRTVIATGTAPAGAAADPVQNLTAIGGSSIAGSALVGIYFPSAVVGSQADRGAAFRAPAFVYLVDRHPR